MMFDHSAVFPVVGAQNGCTSSKYGFLLDHVTVKSIQLLPDGWPCIIGPCFQSPQKSAILHKPTQRSICAIPAISEIALKAKGLYQALTIFYKILV